MILMGIQTFRNRHKTEDAPATLKRDSVFAGIYTTAANAGFILWWLTIGTTLILNAQLFGLIGFSVFAGVHWLCDFAFYSLAALAVFKSQRFWNGGVKNGDYAFLCCCFHRFWRILYGFSCLVAVSIVI